jgi:hypothetical protein
LVRYPLTGGSAVVGDAEQIRDGAAQDQLIGGNDACGQLLVGLTGTIVVMVDAPPVADAAGVALGIIMGIQATKRRWEKGR